MKDFVIYTVLTGGYDNIRQPLVIDDRFDYIFFSDNACEHTIGVWQVRPIPYKNIDSKRVSFYAKSHPESLLEGYKASLFHDANLQITETRIYESVIVAYSSGLEWGGDKASI